MDERTGATGVDKGRKCNRCTRRLYEWEINEAKLVFGNQLDYARVYVHECVFWPNWFDWVGRILKRMPKPEKPNAITLGNHCFFPVQLPKQLPLAQPAESNTTGWLIHELTHVWQYQHFGWRYLVQAIAAQLREKEAVYKFGEAKGLQQRQTGWTFTQFNPEQQGDIARSYYLRLHKGESITAWQPYIEDIQHKV